MEKNKGILYAGTNLPKPSEIETFIEWWKELAKALIVEMQSKPSVLGKTYPDPSGGITVEC